MSSCAKSNLKKVSLELGGKSPVYIDQNCNIEVAAKRIVWGKMVNLGQTVSWPLSDISDIIDFFNLD